MESKGGPSNTECSHTRDLVESVCFDEESMPIKLSRMIPYVFIISFSVVGNILVAVVVFRVRSMRKAVNFFIVNMAISDLLITVVYMPRVMSILLVGYKWLSRGITGLVFCKLVYFVHETALSVSIFSAVCISGERFLAVVRPFKSLAKSTKPARYLIAMTWIVSLVMRVPILLANETAESCGKIYCEFFLDKVFWSGSAVAYHKINLIGMYTTPFGVMVALYSATIVTLKRRDRPGNSIATENTQPSETMNKKVSRMVLVVLSAFLLCWLLYFIISVLESYDIDIPCNVLYFRLFLAHFNCALTPVLYGLFSENYRREFKNVLLGCPRFHGTRARATTVNQHLEFQEEIGPLGNPRQRLETTTEIL